MTKFTKILFLFHDLRSAKLHPTTGNVSSKSVPIGECAGLIRMTDSNNDGTGAHVTPPEETLPTSRTFLLRYSSTARPEDGVHRGRIEHLSSGRTQRFDSLEDAKHFVAEQLKDDD